MRKPNWTSVSPALFEHIRADYRLDWRGTHGYPHWERVRDIGARLAPVTGADALVVEYFAALHDSRRHNEYTDPEHGPRAAELVRTLEPGLLPLDGAQIELLAEACRIHTSAAQSDEPTIGTCLDADRLDLGRVGKRPDARFLSTEAARASEMIEWASRPYRNWLREM